MSKIIFLSKSAPLTQKSVGTKQRNIAINFDNGIWWIFRNKHDVNVLLCPMYCHARDCERKMANVCSRRTSSYLQFTLDVINFDSEFVDLQVKNCDINS